MDEQNSRGSDTGPFLLCEAAELAAEPPYERGERGLGVRFVRSRQDWERNRLDSSIYVCVVE